jgi:hypothetical protein
MAKHKHKRRDGHPAHPLGRLHKPTWIPAKIKLLGRHIGGIGAAILVGMCVAPTPAGAAEAQPFGIAGFTMQTTETNSSNVNEPYMFTQAGGHPWALTTTVQFAPPNEPKDLIIDLPPGLVANPQAVARCASQLEHCPTNTQVGVFELHFTGNETELTVLGAIVNMKPYAGQAAELGLEAPLLGRVILTGRLVRTPQGYTLAIIGRALPKLNLASVSGDAPTFHLKSMETTLWGVPAAAAHNPQRGILCFNGGAEWSCEGGGLSSGEEETPFLTMPSDCSSGALTAVASADSWEKPERFVQAQATLPTMAHCDQSQFDPEIEVRPETSLTETPVGIDMKIKVAQPGSSDTVATSELRNATVTLPQGMTINPGIADGLQACNPSGPTGINIPTGVIANGEPLQPGEVGPGEELGVSEEPELAPGNCPKESIVGTAEATTPLLAHPIEGRVYIATPECGHPGEGPCTEQDAADGNLYRLYVELGAAPNTKSSEGVLIKLAATVQANPATGQLTVRLAESPELPLSELSLRLNGGPGALLVNPSACGLATTTSDMQPWSTPYTPDASPSSRYGMTGCANPTLNPELLAGSVNTSAGATSAFTATVTRREGEQRLSRVQLQSPPGLSALLSSVPLCNEQQATQGTCPETARIGSIQVATGAGSQLLYMPGTIYLTGPYAGAPFGLSIVTDAQAGPLNLGQIVIRARVNINPATAALTITTDPLPQIVLGVPLLVQRLTLLINRPGFIFNPTNCNPQQIAATLTSTTGQSANASNRFALAGCKSLSFAPKLTASTSAHASFKTGANLNLQLTFPHFEPGTEANLARIKLDLPQHLPSRLTALQGACSQATFNMNPAACPTASVVGVATAQTPMLGTGLSGPVYLVTHGRNALPSPVVILQGDGVRLNLPGSSTIDKSGIVNVTFATIPDVPLSSLDMYLPQGAHSLVGANVNLCELTKTTTVEHKVTQRVGGRTVHRTVQVHERLPATLSMPTELVAHNGAAIHQTTQIKVTGCPARGSEHKRN